MKIKIETATKSNSSGYAVMKKAVFKFTIVESVLKTHYKELAKMAFLFNSKDYNSGYILPENKDDFLALVEKIEKSNSVLAEKSHEKAKAKKATKKTGQSFEDFCDDNLNQSLGLMSQEQKAEAYKAFKN